ncbi:AmpG family muropeptide MFS transporter [Pseudoalteromonas tunicata]|uniref:Putative muropeptide transport protein (MFS family protein) n=1 Tax=Pseudoalteromonas tunicata D2 TaxID=87626 RepID=A4C6T1_9GAMM|nr:MFS transporter [Pseudoalteromonas tunicata]ATC95657.1 MFS transporter, PAT family, beta-lactamase induction signal transducer AmpG [Pseudoalteromonas tunicata]AXT31221.1 MFS transporter [Pseudoalteromonas tunicata]EAR29685.1 putative muropeptide transport protein (mFS family protein) [Pseudoalteromonas tunicata D2]MDP4985019.1 MFS transporter [Pseudoalteromonas tunicata]MDP5214866.1 MFS transporter [Pseudoalteromonas tunicata]
MSNTLSIKEYFSYFKDRRLINIFIFGMASGFPWVLIGSVMSAWLKDEGLSRSTIGLFGIVFGVYSINFLWSPLIDRIKLPFLYKKLGQRRSWIFICQLVIVLATFSLSQLVIKDQLFLAALFCFVVALASATQDISIDAFRIDTLAESESHKTTAAAAMATSGWWSGYALLGAIPFYIADFPNWQWADVYLILTGLMLLLCFAVFFAKEPTSNRDIIQAELERNYQLALANSQFQLKALQKPIAWLMVTLIEPFKVFFKKNGVKSALALLAFIFLFKIGEAFLARMSIVFYKEIGFSNTQIANYSKLGTGIITIIFAFFGSIFNHRYGIVKGLMISGIAMAASNLMFSVIAIQGPKEHLYVLAIIIDGFTQAWSLVAMVAFISMLCDRAFTATHYALLASLGNLGRTVLSSYSGVVIDDWLNGNWALFFVLTALMVIPSLLFLWLIRKKLYILEKNFHATSRR